MPNNPTMYTSNEGESHLPRLDPPFRGFIANTYDALLVFEAARRGMIPRVTRRLIDRERSMVQSGAVFIFDEHESGIKRWTDGLFWSPSRILGNFLVYRETLKENSNGKTDKRSPNESSPASPPLKAEIDDHHAESSHMAAERARTERDFETEQDASVVRPPLGGGELQRSSSDGGSIALTNGMVIDRALERSLIGSLNTSYNFRGGGLVKKTMSVQVNGFNQHLVSYYTMEDASSGRLRCPSTVPELRALRISEDYLNNSNFRFPPQTEIGPEGTLTYRGEPEESMTFPAPGSALPPPLGEQIPADDHARTTAMMQTFDPYAVSDPLQASPQSIGRMRSVTAPSSMSYPSQVPPQYPGYYDSPTTISPLQHANPPLPPQRQNSSGPMRPGSSRARYGPYSGTPSSPRGVQSGGVMPMQPVSSSVPEGSSHIHAHARRQSQPHFRPPQDEYYPSNQTPAHDYQYQPPATAPGNYYYPMAQPLQTPHQTPTGPSHDPIMSSPAFSPTSSYPAWHQHGQPTPPAQRYMASPVSPGSSMLNQHHQGFASAGAGAGASVPRPAPPSSAGSAGSAVQHAGEWAQTVHLAGGSGHGPETIWDGQGQQTSPTQIYQDASHTGQWRGTA